MAVVIGFTQADLRAAAGPRSFERGLAYTDAVTNLEITDGEASATVHGTDAYRVVLATDDGDGLWGECDCPYGIDGNFCKHCVALGLVLLRRSGELPVLKAATQSRHQSLNAWLNAQSKEQLLALVHEQLAQDHGLRRRLELRAATADADVDTVRARIRDLLDTSAFSRYGYVEYADAVAYSDQVGEAVAAIRALVRSGRAEQAVDVARETVGVLAAAYENVDDSDGHLGGIADDLGEAHLEACRAARPDPQQTAAWLFRHLTGENSHLPEIDISEYHDVLGGSGRAHLRTLTAEAWTRNPSGWAVKQLMRDLVRAEGDVDAIVSVYAADLAPTGATHLDIARELDAARRSTEALDWAERGLAAASARVHPGLVDYIIARYESQGRSADAVTVRRDRLRAERTLTAYQQLRAAARAADCWQAERGPALELLRADAVKDAARTWRGPVVWIDALIDDGDIAAAWEAAPGMVTAQQELTLADRLTPDRPAAALEVYLRAIEPLKTITGNAAYQEIARLLLRARSCHQHLGTTKEFETYLAGLRAEQKRKRNLMKILDQQGL